MLHRFAKDVPLDDGDPLEVVGQDAGSQQTRHAPPDHHRVPIACPNGRLRCSRMHKRLLVRERETGMKA
jgi:hypothetical protein